MSMPCVNKVFTCLCCHECACQTAQCIDLWASCEACGLANLSYGACCWTLCAPICHKCECGNTSEAGGHCLKCLKYCGYSCALQCCAPIDGCYNCIFYIKKVCSDGVTGFKDILENTKWLNTKIKDCFGLENGNEPERTFNTYTP